jgi:hypothetical protein
LPKTKNAPKPISSASPPAEASIGRVKSRCMQQMVGEWRPVPMAPFRYTRRRP